MATAGDMTAPYLAQFASARPALPGGGAPWLGALRERAIGRFADEGFPTPRAESWKYTNLNRMTRTVFADAGPAPAVDAARLAPYLAEAEPAHLLVFVNGRHAPGLSRIADLPPGATLTTLAEAASDDPAFLQPLLDGQGGDDGLTALNTALMRDGLVLRLDAGAVVERPVHVLHFTAAGPAPAAVHARNLIVAEESSRATVIETYAGDGGAGYWTNSVTAIAAGPGADLAHVRVQREGEAAYHTGRTQITLDRDGRYCGFALSAGAALARNEIRAAIVGEGATCRLLGGSLVRGRQHADNTTEIDHRVPHGESRQVYRNVIEDRGRAVFQGRIIVRPDAQKTNAHQTNRNLLLSPQAQADTKPELRIFADDVKCSHGATVGDLDRDALFYLRSRGIDAARARGLLIEAFLNELIEEAPADRGRLAAVVAAWLAPGAGAGEAA